MPAMLKILKNVDFETISLSKTPMYDDLQFRCNWDFHNICGLSCDSQYWPGQKKEWQ